MGAASQGAGWAGLPLQNSCPVSTEKTAVSNMSIWCLLADNGPWRPFAVFPLEPREAGAFPSGLHRQGCVCRKPVTHRQDSVLLPTLPGDDGMFVFPLPHQVHMLKLNVQCDGI